MYKIEKMKNDLKREREDRARQKPEL